MPRSPPAPLIPVSTTGISGPASTAITTAGSQRGRADVRRASQAARLHLPPLPTTTIGSYPQTAAIRKARAALRVGEIDEGEYNRLMRAEVAGMITLQEELGLDVLVHGEPERNDMVQYFAEQLDGFFATDNGWVQSYGTRCVRPPILYGDVSRPQPMTVGLGDLRAVTHRQAGQGHADRSGDDPGLVVRS